MVAPTILHQLIKQGAITRKERDSVLSKPTTMEKMKALCDLVESTGPKAKDIFNKVLEENDPSLLNDL